jgi:hypothetical protein
MTKLYSPGLGRMVEVDDPLPSTTQPTARNQKLLRAFARMPLKETAAVYKAVGMAQAFVWVWLMYLSWEEKSLTFPMPNNGLSLFGIPPIRKISSVEAL